LLPEEIKVQSRLLAGEEQGRPNWHLKGSFSSRPGDGGKGGRREVTIGKPDAASARSKILHIG